MAEFANCFFWGTWSGLAVGLRLKYDTTGKSAKNTVKAHLSSPFRDEGIIY